MGAEKRTASIIAEETCYAEKLHQNMVIHGLEMFPEDRKKIFAEARIQMEEKNQTSFVDMFKRSWANVDEEFLLHLSEHSLERLFFEGGNILNEGDVGRSMFLLVTGTAG